MPIAPAYATDFDPRTGIAVDVAPHIVRVSAPNGGPYTFTGTNSFILGESRVAVIDPGPDDDAHLGALEGAIAGRPVDAVILTHTHRDHSALARRLSVRTGAPIWSGGPHRLSRPLKRFEINPFTRSGDFDLVPDRTLAHGEALVFDDITLDVIATPGHCANHLSFAVRGSDVLLTGDHVMGWNSTLVATPDGNLKDYLASLDTVIGLSQTRYLPAHGGEIIEGRAFAHALKNHRLMRNRQLQAIAADGPIALSAAAHKIYPALTGRLSVAARRTLLSHAEYLESLGMLSIKRGLLGIRLVPAGGNPTL